MVFRKKNKFNAKKTVIDGIKFHSDAEARRYANLKLWEKIGKISNLRLQVRYSCIVNGYVIGVYISDFVYEVDGKEVVEDVKGCDTDFSGWKRAHVEAQYGIKILVVDKHGAEKTRRKRKVVTVGEMLKRKEKKDG